MEVVVFRGNAGEWLPALLNEIIESNVTV